MSPSRHGRLVLALALVSVMGVACSDDDPAGGAEVSPTDQATTSATTGAAADAGAAATPAGARGGGEVTVGEQTWTFVPTIQCMVTDSGIAIVAGEALDDPSVEFSVDVTPDGQRVDVTIDDVTMVAQGDEVTATIAGTTVSGSATLDSGVETTEATFDLDCG